MSKQHKTTIFNKLTTWLSQFKNPFYLKKIYWLYLLVLLVSIFSTIVFARSKSSTLENHQPTTIIDLEQVADFSQEKIEEIRAEKKSLGVLLLGYGGAGHQGGMLTDTIQLLYFDFEKGKVVMLSIPRDLWVELPSGQQGKINQAFTMGNDAKQMVASGALVAKQMVELITALPVDYYLAIDFVGFKRLIGEVFKGIEVEVSEVLDDPWYPIRGEELNPCGYTPEEIAELGKKYSGFELEKQFPCRYEHIYFKPGLVAMHGSEALAFVRSRHGSGGGDFSRSKRQQELMLGILKKFLSLDGLKKAPAIFEQASYTFSTDLDVNLVKYLLPAFSNLGKFEQKSIILSTSNVLASGRSRTGQSILLPKDGLNNWQTVQTHIQQNL